MQLDSAHYALGSVIVALAGSILALARYHASRFEKALEQQRADAKEDIEHRETLLRSTLEVLHETDSAMTGLIDLVKEHRGNQIEALRLLRDILREVGNG